MAGNSFGRVQKKWYGMQMARMKSLKARKTALALVFAVVVSVWSFPSDAKADDYDELAAGNPVRLTAYLFHPLGVALDYIVVRPMHWMGNHEPFSTIFGHKK